MSAARMGIELRGVCDGVSVWVEPDGTMTNEWEHYKDDCPGSHMRRRYEAAQEYIEQQQKEAA